jgi:hypothetical protein
VAKERVEELEAAVEKLIDERDDALARVRELAGQWERQLTQNTGPATCRRTQECEPVQNMEGQFDAEQKGLLRDLRALVPAWKEHCKLRAAQKKFVERRLHNMRPNEALVGMDFPPFKKTYARCRTLGEGMTGAQTLMVELYCRTEDTRKVKFELEQFMYIPPPGNDNIFVRRALLEFGEVLRERGFTGVQFVSDGGPRHFKLKSSIFFVVVQLKRFFGFASVEWHFWPSNHGKWSYDGMAAVVKREMRIIARSKNELVGGAQMIAGYANSIKNMTASSFKYVDNAEPYNVDGLETGGVKKFHAFRCPGAALGPNGLGEYQIECLEKSTSSWATATSQQARPLFNIDEGLDRDELDREEEPPEDAAAAGRVETAEYRRQQRDIARARRQADVWARVVPGSTLKVKFIVDDDGGTVVDPGTVLRVEEEHLLECIGQYEPAALVHFPDDGSERWIGRVTTEWELDERKEVGSRRGKRKWRRREPFDE